MELTRRNFVGAAACGAAALAAGVGAASNIALADSVVDEPESWDEECEVLILGAGGTGLSAACAAAEAGADVLVIEAAPTTGGTTALSAGVIQAAGTQWQKEFTEYQDDTPEKHAQSYLECAEGIAHEDLVTTMCDLAPELLEWLADIGINWVSVYGACHAPYSNEEYRADRIHTYEGGGGVGDGITLTETETAEAERLGVRFEFETTVKQLVYSAEKGVLGAIVERDGADLAVKGSKGVILALGGIDRNVEMAQGMNQQQYWDLTTQTTYVSGYNNGDGIRLGMAVGGQLAGVGGTIDLDLQSGIGLSTDDPGLPCLIVNSKGMRFVCEDATYAYIYRGVWQQETQIGGNTFMIFDQNAIEQGIFPWPDPEAAIEEGTICSADSLEEMAEKIGVPATNLQCTFDLWNTNIEQTGDDPAFDRNKQLITLDKPPYYAYLITSTNLGSLGGLLINTNAKVIDNNDEVIPGLYSGGMNSGGWYGLYYPGSGTALLGGLAWGHIAGENAAAAEAR